MVFSDRQPDDVVSEHEGVFSENSSMNDFVIGYNSDNDESKINPVKITSQDVVFGVDNSNGEEPVPEESTLEEKIEEVKEESKSTDVSVDEDALNKRLSEIDLLLQELENKK